MGYAPLYFSFAVERWLTKGWLKAGHRLVDFGSQVFDGDPEETRRLVFAFLQARGAKLESNGDALPSVRSVWAAIGVRYESIDVDGNASRFFDLNTFATPADWRGDFDFVNNEGTIEHLANPINGFR